MNRKKWLVMLNDRFVSSDDFSDNPDYDETYLLRKKDAMRLCTKCNSVARKVALRKQLHFTNCYYCRHEETGVVLFVDKTWTAKL